jgi:hypothetical protein
MEVSSSISTSKHLELNTIDINEHYERRAWALSLGISEDTLVGLVQKLGPSADRLRAYIRSQSNA